MGEEFKERELCRKLLKEVLTQRSKKTQKHTVESHQRELIRNQRQNPFVSGSSKENTVLRNELSQRKRNVKTSGVN